MMKISSSPTGFLFLIVLVTVTGYVESKDNSSEPELAELRTNLDLMNRMVSRNRQRNLNRLDADSGPIIVETKLGITGISPLENDKPELIVSFYLYRLWIDPQLNTKESRGGKRLDLAWKKLTKTKILNATSDIEFLNGEKLLEYCVPGSYSSNFEQISFFSFVRLRLNCTSHLFHSSPSKFTCPISLISSHFPARDVEYQWSERAPYTNGALWVVEHVLGEDSLSSVEAIPPGQGLCPSDFDKSCLEALITIERQDKSY